MQTPKQVRFFKKNQWRIRKEFESFLGITGGQKKKMTDLAHLVLASKGLKGNGSRWEIVERAFTCLGPNPTIGVVPSKNDVDNPSAPYAAKKKASKRLRQTVDFYDSKEWRILRYKAIKICGSFCQCCGAKPTPGHPLHVDHIKPRSKYPHLELDLSNLQVLCEPCNLGKLAWDETDWRSDEVKEKLGLAIAKHTVLWDKDWSEIDAHLDRGEKDHVH